MMVARSNSRVAKHIRRRPTLTKCWWATVALTHMAADESCGRDWTTGAGCSCGACRQARLAVPSFVSTAKQEPAR